jgi:FkbM family methyltransferase
VGGAPVALASKHARYPLYCRPGTSDFWVFMQIFVDREYSCFDSLQGGGLVIDCGANVGYSSAYFLSRFPQCEVVAIEPDPDNYAMLVRNLAPYGRRATPVHAGVWSHQASLKLASERYGDGGEWARQVAECVPGERDSFPATSVGDLLRESGRDRIFVLKMDIEGAEGVVFADGDKSWLDRTDNIAIELHDDSQFGPCSEIFHRAIAAQRFRISFSGELTVCQRRGTVVSPPRQAMAGPPAPAG